MLRMKEYSLKKVAKEGPRLPKESPLFYSPKKKKNVKTEVYLPWSDQWYKMNN